MPKIVGILLVLSFVGLHQTDAFARRTPNQLLEFMKKREQIKSGMLTYRYTFRAVTRTDGPIHDITVRFFDARRGPYNYIYTAIIAEDSYGNVLIYDLDSTYKFARSLKRKEVLRDKAFNHHEQYFYEPFAHYSTTFYNLSRDTSLVIRDSVLANSQLQIIESNRFSGNRYIFDSKTSLPIYYRQLWHNSYKDYTLIDNKLNNIDSASFFRMLADSVKSLKAACPNPPIEGKRFYYMPPIQDTVAPDFTFASATGDSIQLSKVVKDNKVVIVDFWFKKEVELNEKSRSALTTLKSLYETYKGQGLEILSLNDYDTAQVTVDSAITEFEIPYPVLFAKKISYRKYRINGYPSIYIIKAGRVEQVVTYEDPDIASTLTAAVKKYLND